jgi:hypothetical protein
MNYYQREKSINDLLYIVGDKVKLPHNEEGVILKIADIPWGFKYLVNITKPTINNLGEEIAFKFEQLGENLSLINNKQRTI